EKHADVHRFVSLLNARRTLREVEHERRRVSLTELIDGANKAWHGVKLYQPDWSDHSHSLALFTELREAGLFVYVILNAYWEPLSFELPPVSDGSGWRRWIDTFLDSPYDIVPWETAPSVSDRVYSAGPRSVVILFRETEPYASKLLPSAAGVTRKSGFRSATAAPIAASSAASSRPGSWWNGTRCLAPTRRAKAIESCIVLCPQPMCWGYSSRVYCASWKSRSTPWARAKPDV